MTESEQILDAIRDQSERSERGMETMANELRNLGLAITKGFARGPGSPEGASFWPISTFVTVIASLGVIFYSLLSGQERVASVRAGYDQMEIAKIYRLMEADNDREQLDAAFSAGIEARLKALEAKR
jgi:hypothetical protein